MMYPVDKNRHSDQSDGKSRAEEAPRPQSTHQTHAHLASSCSSPLIDQPSSSTASPVDKCVSTAASQSSWNRNSCYFECASCYARTDEVERAIDDRSCFRGDGDDGAIS